MPELSILKPVASLNEFPTFVLDDAVIYRKDKSGKLVVANVCNVNLEGPLVVRGKLEVEHDLASHCMPPRFEAVVTNVRFNSQWIFSAQAFQKYRLYRNTRVRGLFYWIRPLARGLGVREGWVVRDQSVRRVQAHA